MAFVFRSSKKKEDQIKTQINLPPLNQLDTKTMPEITKKYLAKNNNIKSNAPFGAKASKETQTRKYNSNSPGPGTYQLSETFLKKSFNQNLTSPFDQDTIEGGPSQLFISKERRFKYMNKTENDNPSPADYFFEKNKFAKNQEKKTHSQYPKPKIYKVFDPHRNISIPSDDFYFEINNKGDIEVKQDIEEIKKCNNTGPGCYDVKYISKNNNSIDWSRTADDIKKNKNKKNDILIDTKENLKINTQLNTFNTFSENFDITYNNNGTNNSTNAMNLNIKQLANKMCNTEINNLEEKNKKRNKLEIKTEDFPGPGDYDITEYIKVPICFSNVTNFGSNASRGLLYPNKDNKILIGHRDKKFLAVIKNNNKNLEYKKHLSLEDKEEIENKLYKNKKNFKNLYDSYKINSIYINNLKERNIINKRILKGQIGPGSYDPSFSFYKNKKDNDIQNFGALEIRFKDNNNDKLLYPGVGTYSYQDSFSQKKSLFTSQVPPNISKKVSEGISNTKVQALKPYIYLENHKQPAVGEYSPEKVNSYDTKVFKDMNYSGKKPGFISGEKRFFEPKYKYEDENQVGKYNLLYKEKEFSQRESPFGCKSDRFIYRRDKEKTKNDVPCSYRYDSYFDWNKKSYNMLFNV